MLTDLGLQKGALAGRVALVTGGAGGIGAQCARLFGQLGAAVVVADLDPRGRILAEGLFASGIDVRFVRCDVTRREQLDDLLLQTELQVGPVDVFVHAATRVDTLTPLLEFDAAGWADALAVNLTAPAYLVSRLVPGMLARRFGVLLAFSTLDSGPLMGSYCASKMGLQSLFRTLAKELPPESGVSSLVVVPGAVDTPLLRHVAASIASANATTPEVVLEGMGNPGYEGLVPAVDAAASCAYFVVHAASYHGQLLDGYLPHHLNGRIHLQEWSPASQPLLPSPAEALAPLLENNAGIERRVRERTQDLETERAAWRRRSLTDALTGLPNREQLTLDLQQAADEAARRAGRFAVLFIDLDRFKPINDTLGHQAGDEVLRQTAERLRRAIRQSDVAARVGGDEFIVLLRSIQDSSDATAVSRKLLRSLERPFECLGTTVSLSASVGVAVFPDHGDPNTVLQKADAAMYAAKRESAGRPHAAPHRAASHPTRAR